MVKTTMLNRFKITNVNTIEWDYCFNRPIRYIGLFTIFFLIMGILLYF
jgi:hypothetical protein